MVNAPSTTTLATALPLMLPNRLDDTMAIFAWPATVAPHQAQREIAQKLGAADDVKHFAEDDENNDDADAHLQCLAENSIGIEIKIGRQPTDRPALAIKIAGKDISKVSVEQKNQLAIMTNGQPTSRRDASASKKIVTQPKITRSVAISPRELTIEG